MLDDTIQVIINQKEKKITQGSLVCDAIWWKKYHSYWFQFIPEKTPHCKFVYYFMRNEILTQGIRSQPLHPQ